MPEVDQETIRRKQMRLRPDDQSNAMVFNKDDLREELGVKKDPESQYLEQHQK